MFHPPLTFTVFPLYPVQKELNSIRPTRQYSLWLILISSLTWPSGSASCWGTAPQDGRPGVRFRMASLEIFKWPNRCPQSVFLGFTQPLTEMTTKEFPWEVNFGRRVELTTLAVLVVPNAKPRTGSPTFHPPSSVSMNCYGKSVPLSFTDFRLKSVPSPTCAPRLSISSALFRVFTHTSFDSHLKTLQASVSNPR